MAEKDDGEAPLTDGVNGKRGRFVKGNRAAAGRASPHAAAYQAWRSAVVATVTVDKLRKVVNAIYAKAAKGDLIACRLLMEHTLGRPADFTALDVEERLADLEARIHEREQGGVR